MKDRHVIVIILIVQALCAFFFVSDILSSVIGLRVHPVTWRMREFIEIGAAIGLLLGVVLGAVALSRTMTQKRHAEDKLRRASTAFTEVLEERFCNWGLTPAERDVALFLIKGLPISDIAALRETSEGTVKAQTNAIYRKANVGGSQQLLSLFIDDLMADAAMAQVTPTA
jgi:DNA-binding CsgD family transcriptional regulator